MSKKSNNFVFTKNNLPGMKELKQISILLLFSFILSSCGDNHYRVRTEGPEPEIEMLRLEKDLFETDPSVLAGMKDSLQSKYGSFLQLFAWVINAGSLDDSAGYDNMLAFATDRYNYDVYNTVMEKYPDMSSYESELEKAWARYLFYFPGSAIPSMYTFISGFNNSIIIGDSVLAVGLDRYLGPGSRYYRELGIYNYLTRKMVPEKIVPDAMYAWAKAGWPAEEESAPEDLLSGMMYEGKLQYFTRCMLYDYPDSLLMGFTSGQMTFCRNNEHRMWEYLIEHDMLFNTDVMLIRKFTGEAPFTNYFTSESPGRAAVWLGFRIVESYMKKNPDVGLEQLMNEDNYRMILEKARYSPSK